MEKPVLNNEDVYPDNNTIKKVLREYFTLYNDLINKINKTPFNLLAEWRYYNDGKSWLCKIIYKKKTVIWLSIWDGYFKLSFYFSEKNYKGIYNLNINNHIKLEFESVDFTGKLKPLIIKVTDKSQIDDILIIADYKMKN